jgi:protein disulfide-isomerase A1
VATGLAERFAIKGFPTIAFFKNGKKLEYNAGRTADDIVAWLKKQSGPPAKTIETAAQLLAAQESNDVIVVGYFASVDSEAAKGFLTVAGGDEVNSYFISSSEDVKNALAVSEDSVVILKSFDDKRADLAAADQSPAQLFSFILGNSVPLVQTFSQEAAKKIFSSPIQKHVLFFTEESSDHHAPSLAALTEVAKSVKGQALVVNVPSTEDRVMDYFGIKKTALPALVVVDMGSEGQMKKYPYAGASLDVEGVSAHVNGVLSGDLKPTLKSEPVSPEDTLSDVVVLRGTSFNGKSLL